MRAFEAFEGESRREVEARALRRLQGTTWAFGAPQFNCPAATTGALKAGAKTLAARAISALRKESALKASEVPW